jgi:hypothetical protein
MMEKRYDLRMLFVDFRKAFDSANREGIYEAMKQKEIPDTLIRLKRMTVNTHKQK